MPLERDDILLGHIANVTMAQPGQTAWGSSLAGGQTNFAELTMFCALPSPELCPCEAATIPSAVQPAVAFTRKAR